MRRPVLLGRWENSREHSFPVFTSNCHFPFIREQLHEQLRPHQRSLFLFPGSSRLITRGDKIRKRPLSRAYFLLRGSVRPGSPTTSNQFIMSCHRRRGARLTALIFIHVKKPELYLVPLTQITQFAAEMKLIWVPVNLLLLTFFFPHTYHKQLPDTS